MFLGLREFRKKWSNPYVILHLRIIQVFMMPTEESEAIALKRWGQFLLDHGWTPEGVKAHQARRGTEMFPITIEQHLEILKNDFFTSYYI